MKRLIPAMLAVLGVMPSLPPVRPAEAFEPYRWKQAQTEVTPVSCNAAACGFRGIDSRERQRDEDSAPVDRRWRQLERLPRRRSEPGASNDRQDDRRYLGRRPASDLELRRREDTPRFAGRNGPRPKHFDREWRDADWYWWDRHPQSAYAWRPYPPGVDVGTYAPPTHPLTSEINAALRDIEQGLYAEALWRLRNDVLGRTDGCATTGFPDADDWIETCADQLAIYHYVQLAIRHLQTLVSAS